MNMRSLSIAVTTVVTLSACADSPPSIDYDTYAQAQQRADDILRAPATRTLVSSTMRRHGADCPVADVIAPRSRDDALDIANGAEMIRLAVTCVNGPATTDWNVRMSRDGKIAYVDRA